MTSPSLDHIGPRDFQRLARFIQSYSGIKMPPSKKTMVEGRLRRRLRAVGVSTLSEYCDYLFDRGGLDAEAVHLIDAVTTNKTDFFREPDHFRFLVEQALPQLLARRGASPRPLIQIWSAACSIGAEPYTLAMVLSEFGSAMPGLRVSIVATDLSTDVLQTAMLGIYPQAMIGPIPEELRRRYLLRAKRGKGDRFRVVPELRRMVAFGRLNLMEPPFAVDRDMDAIFCRNILIYFDKPTQHRVVEQLCEHLRPGGFLFLGHSETLTGFTLPLRLAGTNVFQRE